MSIEIGNISKQGKNLYKKQMTIMVCARCLGCRVPKTSSVQILYNIEKVFGEQIHFKRRFKKEYSNLDLLFPFLFMI